MDGEEYSDLTDIDSDEYRANAKKKNGKGKAGASGGYKVRNALKAPRATTYTAQSLHQQIHSGEINKDPEYQREVVWPETKMVGLIDSIFRNFYIPPIIFAVTSHDDGSETRVCIDGKQRLTSIQKFMDGLIAHKDPATNEKLWYTNINTGGGKGSRAKRLLPEKYKRLFANKQIVCVEYQDITDNDEREIFQRVQLGMALTPSEKLQVIGTPRAVFIRTVQHRFLRDSEGLGGEYVDWDQSRGNDFRCLSATVFGLNHWSPTLKGSPSIVKLEKWLNEDGEFPSSFKDKVSETFKIFSDIATSPTLGKCFRNEEYSKGKVSPIEFICAGLLIGVHGAGIVGTPGGGSTKSGQEKLSLQELAKAITKMRETVRAEHEDIRMNDRVAKTMMDYIRSIGGLKRKRGGESDGESLEQGEVDVKPSKVGKASASKPLTSSASPAVSGKPGSWQVNGTATTDKAKTTSAKPDRLAAMRAAKTQSVLAAPSSVMSTPTTLLGLGDANGLSPSEHARLQQLLQQHNPGPASVSSGSGTPVHQPRPIPMTGNTGNGNRVRLELPPDANPALTPYHPYEDHGGGGWSNGGSARNPSIRGGAGRW